MTALTTAWAGADVSVSITSTPNPASTGSNLTYTITVTNAGPMTATDVMVTNKLSDGQILASGAGSSACPAPGPVAWWKAEGNTNDSAGTNSGVLVNGATFDAGKVGSQAFSLDGTDDYVSFLDSPSLRPTNFTIEGWFYPSNASLSGVRILVSKTFGASNLDSFAIFLNGGVINGLVSDAGGFDIIGASTALTAGQWYHIAYTFDDASNSHILYTNGVVAASATTFKTLPYDSNPVLIGADIEGGIPSFFFSGLADEVTIYDYVLSATAITNIYAADSAGKCSASTLLLIGDLPSEATTNVTLTVVATNCSGMITNIVCVTTADTDPNPDNNMATNAVTVADLIVPTITCVADKTVECASAWDFDAPSATDNCGSATVSIVSTTTNSAGFCGDTFEATRTWEATDAAGNIAQCSQTVTVEDTTDPTITCADDKTVECGSGWDFDAPSASDTCGSVTVTIVSTVTNAVGFCGLTFEVTRTWEATDDCGNVSLTCDQKVTVEDTTDPTITCVGDKTVECGSVWDFDAPMASDTCGSVTVSIASTVTNAVGFCGLTFEVTRTWEATDDCGNTAQCSQKVTVVDTTDPMITCVADKAADCDTPWDFDAPSASDTCGGVTVSIVSTVTNTLGGGSFEAIRTWEATDDCTNTAQCSQKVTVTDGTPPTITCVADKTVECGSGWNFDAPTASDTCSSVTVSILSTVTNAVGFCGQTFEATRTWEATDAAGNMAECSQKVTVQDTTDPTITCVADKTVECGSVWSFDAPGVSDNCGSATVSIVSTVTNAVGFCGQTFEAMRTWEATDDCGNVSLTCSQKVTVEDTTDPTIDCVADKTAECGSAWDFDAPMASDICGSASVSVVSTVTNAVGFCGQTFEATRTWEATDDCGNTAQCSQKVTVVDTTDPMITCVADKAADCDTPWDFDAPSASDTCGGVTVSIVSTVTNTLGGGSFEAIRTWEATDDCTNTAQCSQKVTVTDGTPPTITCVADKTVECGSGWNFDAPTASDTCSSVTVSILSTTTNAVGFCGQTFEATRTWKASDAAGNMAQCSQKVTVEDTTDPTITCVADKTVNNGSTWDFDAPSASDTCGSVTVTIVNTVTNAGVGDSFTVTRTWKSIDACNNESPTCSQTVTVNAAGPIPMTSLALWLKADTGVVTNSPEVTQWTDQSGTNRHASQVSVANQPIWVDGVLNGLPVVRFDGVNDFLTFNLPVNGLGGMSIFLVAANTQNQVAGATQAERAALFWNETAAWGTVYLTPFQEGVRLRFGTGQANNQPAYPRPVSVGSSFTLSTAIKDGTTDALYVNGTLALSQDGKVATIAACQDTGNLGRGFNNNTYYAGDIAEVLVYTRALSPSEQQAVEQYLDDKYALTTPLPPQISSPPSDLTVPEPAAATFSVTATGTQPLSYQWRREGTNLPGASSSTYMLSPTSHGTDNGAHFDVMVTNLYGAVTSVVATLTVNPVPPTIQLPPADLTVIEPDEANFSVVATGTQPLMYQWRREGTNVPGANSSSYMLSPTSAAVDNGAHFDVVITNDFGAVTSAVATLTVNVAGSLPVTGLTLWLKADVGVVTNSPEVTQWSDQSGNDRHASQGSTASQPVWVDGVLNGLPVVRFDGVNDFLTFNLPVNGLGGMSLFLVAANTQNQVAGATQAERAALFWNETAGWGTLYLTPFQTSVRLRFGTTQAGNQPAHIRPTTVGSAFTLSTAIKDGTNDALYVNGGLALSQGGKLPSIAECQATGNVGRGYNDNTHYAGDIAEVLVYTRALSPSEQQAVEQYLDDKYALTAPLPPQISSPPSDLTVQEPAAATFSVTATGTQPLSYQWRREGTNLPGASSSTYMLSPTSHGTDNGAHFDVVVTNLYGSVTSVVATLTVNPVPPTIQVPPADLTVLEPNEANFNVVAMGTPPLSYQWRREGTNVPGANSSSYMLSPTSAAVDNGAHFDVVITNDFGAVTSVVATLTVSVPGSLPVTGLALWLKADAGVVTNSPEVTQWTDQSGNNRHASQGSAASQPVWVDGVLNGLPVVRFDGVNDFLTFNLPVNGLGGMSLFLVAANTQNQVAGTSQAERAALFWNETAAWGTLHLTPFQTSVRLRFGTTQAGNQPAHIRPVTVGSAFTLSTAIKDGTTDVLYVNGGLVLSQGGKMTTIAGCQPTGNVGRGYNDNTYYAGDIAEVLVYTQALSPSEQQAVQQYLNGKYSLFTPLPPEITNQPADLTVEEPIAAMFSVMATGTQPLSYQWRREGTNVPGANSSTYMLSPTSHGTDNGAHFDVVVTNLYGAVTSVVATLTVNPVPPTIQVPPTDLTVFELNAANFGVVATGTQPLTYQWRRAGTDITDATNSSYTLSSTSVATDHGAQFTVVVSNAFGMVTSVVATLTVLAPGSVPVTDLALWLRADVGVVTNSPEVTQWSDQSGNNRHASQGSAASQPVWVDGVLNGLPVVRFDGVNDFLTFNLPVNDLGGMSLFLVAANTQNQVAGATQAERAALFWNEAAAWGTVYLTPFQESVRLRFGTGQANNQPAYPRPVTVGSGFTLSTAIKDGTTDALYVNGTLALSQGGKLPAIGACQPTGNVGRGYNDNTHYAGDIAEVLVYTRALSASEQQAVEQYLDNKYALTPPPPPPPPLPLYAAKLAPGASLSLQAEPGSRENLQLVLTGQPGATYVLERSPDLIEWTQVTTITLPLAGPLVWSNRVGLDDSSGFFRARLK